MYEWQNKSELFLPSGFSIPFCKGVGGYVSYESSIKSNEPCVIDAAHARFLAKKRPVSYTHLTLPTKRIV